MKLYRIVISPLVNQLTGTYSSCRYFPTCSQYFEQAVRKYGWLRGGAMGFKRIANCHPGGKGGYKPVI
ncbi:membrane protein insertion efficiency factor YidD [Candidatus Microgenomates bacterium]|nr:membrane protein insertion efficiency factor YidD [Candidatus Microgenomates bacterium]